MDQIDPGQLPGQQPSITTKEDAAAPRQMVGYRSPDLPPPVTRGERIAVLTGYGLLAGGLLALPWLIDQPGRDRHFLYIALGATVLGATVTAYCYITNAIRRM